MKKQKTQRKKRWVRSDLLAMHPKDAGLEVQYEKGGGLEAGFLGVLTEVAVMSEQARRFRLRQRRRK